MSLEPGRQIVFGPFRLDQTATQLWRGERVVALQPKPLAVLQYLVQRPGQVVTKQELLKGVWDTIVSKAVVKECVRAIRGALEEKAETPQYIETIGRDGYRFLGEGKPHDPAPARDDALTGDRLFVGREKEVAQLQGWLHKALNGDCQLVFVTGEPGIGKTTVVDLFRVQVQATAAVTIGYGQCIEHYGEGEAYLPMLEAMSRLCREEGGQQIIALLRQYAPTWLVQLSGVLDEGELQALRLQVQGATQQRMLREMAEAIEARTARRPLVLLLEDLHWSDHATVELLAYLAKRRQRMRLLVVATYRPVDVAMSGHPVKTVKQELQAHGQCEELHLELLTKPNVHSYVMERFGANAQMAELAAQIHRRTEGNALFMVNVVEDLLTQGCIVQEQGQWTLTGEVQSLETPESLRQLISKQLERLNEEGQRVLEVASVAGAEFTVAAVAAGLRQDIEAAEDVCEELAWQGHFVEEQGLAEWPDGTVSGKYAFRHALYQNVFYERIAEARRVRLHRVIGERLETVYGEQAKEIAAELAVHFEQGRDYPRAVQYLQLAGENAMRRSAPREAIGHLTKALELLKTLPDTFERVQQELGLQITLGTPLVMTKGYAAPEVEGAYARARELCQQVGETPQLFPVIFGLFLFYLTRSKYKMAHELAEQLLRLAQREQDSALLLEAHFALGTVRLYLGEIASAEAHMKEGISLYSRPQHSSHVLLYGQDPGVACRAHGTWPLWLLGYPDQALKRSQEALTLAQELSHPFSLAVALHFVALIHQFRREGQAAQKGGGGSDTLCQRARRQAAEGLAVLAEALTLVEENEERWWEAEVYRIKGELLLAQSGGKSYGSKSLPATRLEAEQCFDKAIKLSRHQQAKSLELRAVMSLSRLWQKQGKKKEARRMLAKIYGWFTEGFDTVDLQEAKALLEELGSP